jgi:hypothetical protein
MSLHPTRIHAPGFARSERWHRRPRFLARCARKIRSWRIPRPTGRLILAAFIVTLAAGCSAAAPTPDPSSPAGRYLAAAAAANAIQTPLIAAYRANSEDLAKLQPIASQLADSYAAFARDVRALKAYANPEIGGAVDGVVAVEGQLESTFRSIAAATSIQDAARAGSGLTDLFRQESVAVNALRGKLGLPTNAGPAAT